MKNYVVNAGFMAFQFDNGKPTWSIGIECNALANAGIYHCIVGKGKTECLVSMDTVNRLMDKYGVQNIIRKQGKKNIYVIPVHEVAIKKISKLVKVPDNQKSLLE